MRNISINQPGKLVVGQGSLNWLVRDLCGRNIRNLFMLVDPNVAEVVLPAISPLQGEGTKIAVHRSEGAEPTFGDFEKIIQDARSHGTDFVIGIGGGSVLDLAKLVAALTSREAHISSFVGSGLVRERSVPLVCLPTTSGAGSESSPNAILIDETDNSKKGIIDAVLMPDEVYIDPALITSLPPHVTAYTGLDALTHCIEAYANKFAHPVIDMYALEGVRLISRNLGRAIRQGDDLDAREKVALGAYYGGMCLGPVNTAAVHALAYPLGTKYKIAHGLSNALLLPFVLEYNLESASERYAEIALAMGGEKLADERETALQGIALIRKFINECGIPSSLSELNIPDDSVSELAEDALLIQRLLKNNVKEVHLEDAISIYQSAF